jgi:hypothetical protein
MPSRLALAVLVVLFQSSGWAAPPPAAPPVLLRWKLPEQKPLAFELTLENVSKRPTELRLSFDALKDSQRVAEQRRAVLSLNLPQRASMAAVLSPKPSGDMTAKVILTRVDIPKSKRPSRQDKQMAQELKKMEGRVQIRGLMTSRGFVTSDIKREQRNLLALMFELPSQPVAVGDTWTHSADLVKMGRGFEGESESINRLQLVELQKGADGRTVAVIDITLAERQAGHLAVPKGPKLPSSMEMSFVGQGEFLVEEGRWKQLTGRMSTLSTGVMESESEQQFVLSPLDPIPAQVLAAE